MSSIIMEPSSTAQWQKLVQEAEVLCDYQLGEELESYLVFLLMRFLEKPDFTSKIMALDYLHGLISEGQLQQDRLRDVGDHCLLFSGLFPKIAERRRVKISYYVGMGRSAYSHLAETCREKLCEFYHALSEAFVKLMDILQAIRSMGGHHQVLTPLEALELWGDTQSQIALKTLRQVSNSTPILGSNRYKH